MRRRFEVFIITLIVISLLPKFFLIPFNQGMWWDEAVYLGLGRSITHGFYSLEPGTTIETFRPPLFPLLVSPLSQSPLAARFFVGLTSVLAVVCVYLLGREVFDRKTGLMAALFTSGSFYFVFFSTKVLSEPLTVIMVSMSALFFHKWTSKGENTHLYLSAVFAALAFMTRYFGAILFLSYIMYFAHFKRDKSFFRFLLVYFAALAPWILMSQLYYGNPAGAIISNFGYYAEEVVMPLGRTLRETTLVFGFMMATLPVGLWLLLKEHRKYAHLSVFILLSLSFFAFLHHKEPRYMLSFYPAYSITAAHGLVRIGKFRKMKFVAPVVMSLMIVTTVWALQETWIDRSAASGMISATKELRGIAGSNETILAQSYPYVYYFAQLRAVKFPYIESEVGNTVRNNSINYVLYHKFEDGNPEYAAGYFSRFETVKEFAEWGDPEAVVIYRINVSAQEL